MAVSVINKNKELQVLKKLQNDGYRLEDIKKIISSNRKIKNVFEYHLSQSERKAYSFLKYCLEKEERDRQSKGENKLFYHEYRLSYYAPFSQDSLKDKSLHKQIVSFIGSVAGVTDVSLVPSKSKSSDSSSVKDIIFATEYYVPVKSVVIDDSVYLKGEAVKVTDVNDEQKYVELNHNHKIDYETFFEVFQPFQK